MDSSLQEIFEFELKKKLSERAKSSAGEMRILLNGFKFFDLNYTGIINKNQWIQGVFRTGLTGFNESELDSLFSVYDKNNTGQIDYKNFCSFLYGREPLNPITNDSQSLSIQQNNNNINQPNQFNENSDTNFQQNKQMENYNQINNNIQNRQKTPLYNNNQNNINSNNRRTPINYNNQSSNNNDIITNQPKKINNNFINNQRTPFNNNIEYQDNSNFRRSQRKINSYNNTFNNIFQQDISPTDNNLINNNKISFNNLSEGAINSIISKIRDVINTNNGITLYTFIKNVKSRQSNNSEISIDELNKISQEMRLNISLNDLQILFSILNGNQNNSISSEELINVIRGNLDERRKIYIIGIFSNIDKEKKGSVSIELLKNIYNTKYHPDVLNGIKTQQEAFEQFCYSLDLYCEINGIPTNGNLSFQNFVDYYSGVSSCIPDEVYFEDMLKGVWTNVNNSNDYNVNNSDVSNNVNNDDYNKYGINSILMGIRPNEKNNNFNNRFNKSNRFNPSQFNINNQFNNNDLININNNNQFDKRMKNSMSSPTIKDNNKVNSGNAQSNNNMNNNSNNQMLPNSINEKLSTPYNTSKRTTEGIKVYQNKRRYNPITDEYYETEITNNNNSINNNFSTSQNSVNSNINNINQKANTTTNNNNNSGILDTLRNILISRGPKSIFTFQRMLSIYDRQRTGQISLDDFNTIFQTYNLNLTNNDIQSIFQNFDNNQTGVINYDILLNNLIGQMSEKRLSSVQKVFNIFNKNENGEVLMSEIKQKYNPSRHPDVVNEKKNKEEVYGEFLDKLEIFREYNDNLKGSFSTTMNFNEFAKFYNEISMNIKDDNLFDYLLNNCWDMDKFLGNNPNFNNNMNNNSYKNNFDKNIRARTGKQIMNMGNRGY